MRLNDVNFVETDAAAIKNAIIRKYEAQAGRTLALGDPVRLILEIVAALFVQFYNKLNYTGRMNLLYYAEGDFLDHLAAIVDTTRLPAEAATAHMLITLSAARSFAVTVVKGTRVRAAGDIMFSLDRDVVIPSGQTTATATATCNVIGVQGNGFAAGEISDIVDPNPYVQSISNTTTSEGGSDVESDEALRQRAHEAPEHFSVAGPEKAYRYFAMSVSSQIADVAVMNNGAGKVSVYPLLQGGVLPETEMLTAIANTLADDNVRPDTDHVTVLAPTVKNYSIQLTYYIDSDDAVNAATITDNVNQTVAEYVAWQKAALGRDVNPTELYYRLRAAGVKRAVIEYPAFTVVAPSEVATLQGEAAITYGGLEDG